MMQEQTDNKSESHYIKEYLKKPKMQEKKYRTEIAM
jgi:hypothetical protein